MKRISFPWIIFVRIRFINLVKQKFKKSIYRFKCHTMKNDSENKKKKRRKKKSSFTFHISISDFSLMGFIAPLDRESIDHRGTKLPGELTSLFMNLTRSSRSKSNWFLDRSNLTFPPWLIASTAWDWTVPRFHGSIKVALPYLSTIFFPLADPP